MVHGAPARKKSQSDVLNSNNGNVNGTENLQPTPPDGGWGWMVVFGSFMIHIITDGMTYSFGLFYNEFLNYFNEGKGYTAWIVSIMVGVTFASGPISSSFVNRYGCRTVTIAGSILSAICIVISTFAQNVLTLIITIGFGTGLGFGLIYLPAIVSVSTWFEAKRSLATGIAVCGSGFGTFVFAPLTEYLIAGFGWRGALLIIGGIVLNCIIFGAMFRPLKESTAQQPSSSPPPPPPTTTTTTTSGIANKKKDIIDQNTTQAELEPLRNKGVPSDQQQYTQLQRVEVNSNSNVNGHCLSQSNSASFHQNNHTDCTGTNSGMLGQHLGSNDNIGKSLTQLHPIPPIKEAHREISGSGQMYRPDILYQGSLHNIPEYMASRGNLSSTSRYSSSKHSRLHLNHQENHQKDLENSGGEEGGCFQCSQETRDALSEMMNFSLLKDVVFIIFAVSNFCTSIGFNMPYVYVVAQAEAIKLTTEQSSYLISIIGVSNTVSRIILGYISDKTWVNRQWVYNVSLTICGVATAICPLCQDFNSLAFYCAVFGFTIGAYVGLTSVILVDLLGLDKLTNAFGLLLLFQGVASFIGPPIGGWLYDITLSYGPAFLLAGTMIAISGLVMFLIPPIQRQRARALKLSNANGHEMSTNVH